MNILEEMVSSDGATRTLFETTNDDLLPNTHFPVWGTVKKVFPFVDPLRYHSIGITKNHPLYQEDVATGLFQYIPDEYQKTHWKLMERKFFLGSKTICDKAWDLYTDQLLPELPPNIDILAYGEMVQLAAWPLPNLMPENPYDVYFQSDTPEEVCEFYGEPRHGNQISHFAVTYNGTTGEFYRFKEYMYNEGGSLSAWQDWGDYYKQV